MIDQLLPYIPTSAKEPLSLLLNQYQYHLKIVNARKTKRGDFRATQPLPTITINNNLSKEQFLITLVHEIAHLETYLNHPKAKAHGQEWKLNFQRLMLPFLNNAIFKENILKPLANHLINPKASTDTDTKLSIQLQNNNLKTDAFYIFDLQANSLFSIKNSVFKLLYKQRTRYVCLEISTNKKFLIRGNALVKVVEK